MKKLLIFSLAYYPRVGGAEVAIKEITDRIDDIEFHLLTLRFSSRDAAYEKLGNVHVHRVGFGGAYLSKILFVPLATVNAWSLNRAHRFDAWWAMMSYMLFPIVLLRVVGVRRPYALTLQEGDPFRHMFGRWHILPFRFLLSKGFRDARVVQAISTYLAGWARYMGYAGIMEIIPNGVDIGHFEGPLKSHEGTVLITTSRLVYKNGIDTVIRALPDLPYVRFRILGSGPNEGELRALADELGVLPRVEFAGHVEHTALPAALRAADIFVRPSRSEGMGNSFVEAFAAGIPVIATQEGGLKDFITPEVAWPVKKDKPQQVVEAVRAIHSSPERTRAVVARAQQLARERFDWNRIAQSMRTDVFEPLFV